MSCFASLIRHDNDGANGRHHQTTRGGRDMTDYLLLYRHGEPAWKDRSPEEIKVIMAQWNEWFRELEAGGHLRNPGAPLTPGGAVLRRNGDGFATDATLSEVKELVGGYSVIQASSLDEATRLAEGSPFLRNNPKGDIEVRQVLVMDG
jgi:hypothetical protein